MFSRYLVSQVKHNSYFLCGVALGLWVALAVVPLDEDLDPCVTSPPAVPLADEYEPQREERPSSNQGVAGGSAARVVQRPRYYSTELGMRSPLLAAVMTSEEALDVRADAINRTAAPLQPALRFFMTARGLQASGRANVVGFTDTREMLKPFHALKYLADNYLEEYNFFFLVSDAAFLNAHRLRDLVSHLSVSQDVYMGMPADDESHYCSLEGGILLSNSVLRSVHASLDWCVRNSYSPHHHENLGRCVLHAASVSCTATLQDQVYLSVRLDNMSSAGELTPALADAVTAAPAHQAALHYQLHAYVSRVYLERGESEKETLRAQMSRIQRRHPPGFRNVTWPRGLRLDPGLQPPPPENRFDHLRWTLFNASHALFVTDHAAAAPHAPPYKQALQLVLEAARAWAVNKWHEADTEDVTSQHYELVEGAWRWQPATALHYRLLLRGPRGRVRQLEVVRPLGAARLVAVPYVTESAQLVCVLGVRGGAAAARGADDWLQRYRAVALQRDRNTDLVVVLVHASSDNQSRSTSDLETVRRAVQTLAEQHRDASLRVLDVSEPISAHGRTGQPISARTAELQAGGVALAAAMAVVSSDALLLTVVPDMEFNEDFLNRARMNSVAGASWYSPVPFARYAQYAHPLFRDAAGRRPQTNTGAFDAHELRVLAVHARDLRVALQQQGASLESSTAALVLARSALRCVRAPEPGLVLQPPSPPCPPPGAPTAAACLAALRGAHFRGVNLGAKHALAKLLLETAGEERASA